jgi:hypothetical protein
MLGLTGHDSDDYDYDDNHDGGGGGDDNNEP